MPRARYSFYIKNIAIFAVAVLIFLGILKIRKIYFPEIPEFYFLLVVGSLYLVFEYVFKFMKK